MTIAVIIDGVQVPSASVLVLFQRTPFPGGHRYAVTFDRPRQRNLNKELPVTDMDSIKEDDARDLLSYLGMLILPGGGKPQYFLNSVSNVEADEYRVSLHGVCSRIDNGAA